MSLRIFVVCDYQDCPERVESPPHQEQAEAVPAFHSGVFEVAPPSGWLDGTWRTPEGWVAVPSGGHAGEHYCPAHAVEVPA